MKVFLSYGHDEYESLAKKYNKYFKVINTTNGYQFTGAFPRILLNISRAIKYGL